MLQIFDACQTVASGTTPHSGPPAASQRPARLAKTGLAPGPPPIGRAAPVIVGQTHQVIAGPILFDGSPIVTRKSSAKEKGFSVATTRSIFEKVCPSCMATSAIDARRCACGYDFVQDQPDSGLSSEEIRIKAEELYENYLAARADQAAQAVKTAQAQFAIDPANADKSSRVDAAIREAREAQSALQAQSARIAEMKRALRSAVATAAPAASAPKPATAPAPITAAPKKRPAAKPEIKVAPVRPGRKAITAVTKLTVTSAKRTADAPVPAAPKHHVAAAPAKPLAAVPVQSTMPNKAFRKAQAAKAEKILRATQAAKPAAAAKTETLPEAPAAVAMPTPSPVATVPSKTAPRLYATADKKDCPNCTSSVALNATRCRCGYEFPSSEQHIPALSMSEEERAAFAKLFS
jgi:ribosomal protein L40E